MERCEFCHARPGAHNGAVGARVCERCWLDLCRADTAWNARSRDDDAFEDWAAGGGDL